MDIISNIDIINIENLYIIIEKDFYNNFEINMTKHKYNNIKKDNIDFLLLQNHINTIIKFENNLINVNYIITVIKKLYKENNSKYITLYDECRIILDEIKDFYSSLCKQSINLNNIFK
jgi:hypothetical protein